MTVSDALRSATVQLADTSDTARLDAELLMAHALGCSRTDLLLRHQRDTAPAVFAELTDRRMRHEPVAYIIGHQEFYGLDLIVSPDVLIPRGDSETLIEAARSAFAARAAPRRILDLGTGSGALLLAALSVWPEARGFGIERSPGAIAIARQNTARHDMAERAVIREGDWTAPGWREELGQFDLVLANPPYVEAEAQLDRSVSAFEPASALFAGADGLDDYRVLVPQLPGLLTPSGTALIEIGWTQGNAVTALAEGNGLQTRVHLDLGKRERAVEMARKA